MWDIICGNIIYVIIIVVGILCIGIASVINYLEGKRIKETLTATVMDCRQVEKAINGMYLKAYEIDLELSIGSSSIIKTITRGKEMQQWDRVNVLYNCSKDEISLLEVEKKNTTEVPKVLSILGMIIIAIDLIVVLWNSAGMDERTRAHLLSIAVVSVFTFIGVYLCVIIPNKRNKRSFNSELVKGVIVDYIRTGRKRITFTGRIFFSSMPIYEYYYNGEKRKLRGNVGGTAKKYRQIGREVTIAVDRENGKAYCIEDDREMQNIGVIIVVATVALMLLIASWI